MNKFC